MAAIRLAAVALLLTVATVVTAPPAAAGPDVCVGTAQAITSNRVYYPTFGPSATGSVFYAISSGGCLLGHSAFGGGAFSSDGSAGDLLPLGNHCGHSEGDVALDDHTGHWITAASVMVLVGGITGVASVTPLTLTCLGGADAFQLVFAVALT